ncbi:type II toxin-antitoxin system prevent-host-death family antitoxin [bacterium]|nr:type II toxin-antitoxin system prevent-host-death family antitoxin [bacterium]
MIVPSSEFQKNFGHFKELAQREPVTVTSNGRESVVLISAAEFAELCQLREERAKPVDPKLVDREFRKRAEERAEIHREVLEGLSR